MLLLMVWMLALIIIIRPPSHPPPTPSPSTLTLRKAAAGSRCFRFRLASCRAAVAHPCEPGTLITALTHSLSAVGPPPLCCHHLPSREETTASLSIRISLCYRRRPLRRLVFQAFRLFSARHSPRSFTLFLYRFACPLNPLCLSAPT